MGTIVAQELRIGNLIMNEGKVCIVKGINTDDFIQCRWRSGETHYTWGEPVDSFKPIPLTPERLERFGFEHFPFERKSVPDFWRKIHERTFGIDLYFYKEGPTKGKYATKGSRSIQSVHQLQNLYYALTGKELELKPEK